MFLITETIFCELKESTEFENREIFQVVLNYTPYFTLSSFYVAVMLGTKKKRKRKIEV